MRTGSWLDCCAEEPVSVYMAKVGHNKNIYGVYTMSLAGKSTPSIRSYTVYINGPGQPWAWRTTSIHTLTYNIRHFVHVPFTVYNLHTCKQAKTRAHTHEHTGRTDYCCCLRSNISYIHTMNLLSHLYTRVHVRMQRMHLHIFTFAYSCSALTHTHTHTHTHTNTHIHIHTR